MSIARRIARNAGTLALSQGVTLTLNFITWAFLARTLAPAQFGIIGFGTALLAYFGVVVQLGFDAVVVRDAARDPSRLPALAGQLTALRLVLCAVALSVYVGVVFALPRPPLYRATLLVLGLQLVVYATRLNWTFQAVERMGTIAIRDTIVAVLNAAVVFALVRRPEQVILAAALTAGVPLVGNAWLWRAYRRAFGPLRLAFDRVAWGALLRPAIPLAASAFLIEIYVRMDQVMLEFLSTTEAVGQYSAAYKFISLTQLPANIAFSAFFPSLAAALGARVLMRERGRMLARAMLPIGLTVAAAGPWLARDTLVFAYGAEYAAAAPAFALLLVNAGIVHVNMAVGTPLMAWNRQTPYMWAILGGAVANVVLNVVLIPPFGMVGAAAATISAEATVCVGLCRLYWRETGDLPFEAILPAGAVAGAASLVAWLGTTLELHVLVSGPLVIAAAAGVAWRLGLVSATVLHRSASTDPDHPSPAPDAASPAAADTSATAGRI